MLVLLGFHINACSFCLDVRMVVIASSTQSIEFVHLFIHLLFVQTFYICCMDNIKPVDVVIEPYCSFWMDVDALGLEITIITYSAC